MVDRDVFDRGCSDGRLIHRLMKVSGPQFRTDRVFAAIFVLSVAAVLLFILVVLAEKWALRHHGPRIGSV